MQTPDSRLKLTKRQTQIVCCLLKGMSNTDISRHLDIEQHTVKVHIWRMFKKFNVKNRAQLINSVISSGLYKLPQISDIELENTWQQLAKSRPSLLILIYGKIIVDMTTQVLIEKLFPLQTNSEGHPN